MRAVPTPCSCEGEILYCARGLSKEAAEMTTLWMGKKKFIPNCQGCGMGGRRRTRKITKGIECESGRREACDLKHPSSLL